MKRVEFTIEDDAIAGVLSALAEHVGADIQSLKIDPIRVRASRAKAPAPVESKGGDNGDGH